MILQVEQFVDQYDQTGSEQLGKQEPLIEDRMASTVSLRKQL